MTDCLSRFTPPGIKLGKRSREVCLISQEYTHGCSNLSELTHVPSAPSPRLNPKGSLTRSCFKSLADLSGLDQQYVGQFIGDNQKSGYGGASWGWFVEEE